MGRSVQLDMQGGVNGVKPSLTGGTIAKNNQQMSPKTIEPYEC